MDGRLGEKAQVAPKSGNHAPAAAVTTAAIEAATAELAGKTTAEADADAATMPANVTPKQS